MISPPLVAPRCTVLGLPHWPQLQVSFLVLLFLVLLVGAPTHSHHGRLYLPVTTHPLPYLPGTHPVHIAVQRDGMVLINQKWYLVPELPQALAKALRSDSSSSAPLVIVTIDRSLSFATVRRLFRLLSAAGATKVVLETESERPLPVLAGT